MTNVLFLGWNRPVIGREAMASELFGVWMGYWQQQQQAGNIESFDATVLSFHGGDMNGFFIVKGDNQKLSQLRASDEFIKIAMQTGHVLQGFGVVDGWSGGSLMDIMSKWGEMVRK